MLFKKQQNVPDMLEQKKQKLNTYSNIFNKAVFVVNTVIDTLTEANVGIEQSISEINEYQQELSNTAKGLQESKDKNEEVIKNFKALIAE
ncbi:MAG: hypothetical protein E7413_00955 [Ruminococcaceae bacterium]|nr:hypothetical protein [Oscillospiraceae bacterium]